MLELPNGDFARTVLRELPVSASFMSVLWRRSLVEPDASSPRSPRRVSRRCRYHQQHLGDWVVRLGDGTDESHRRACQARSRCCGRTQPSCSSADAVDRGAAADGIGPAWSTLEAAWLAEVEPVLAEATLTPTADTPFRSTGKLGRHSEHMGYLLAEMQSLQRAFPGAVW